MDKGSVRFVINTESSVAVYVQLENIVRYGIASGRLCEGDTLPSVRELSAALNTNPNTITKAYRDLELMGLAFTRRGVGVIVAEGARGRCLAGTRAMALAHLREAAAECLAGGLTHAEIRACVDRTVQEAPPPYAPADGKPKSPGRG